MPDLFLIAAALAAGAQPAIVAEPARARRTLAGYVSRADYPAAALRAREQGRVAVALGIGPDGRVSDCKITASAGSALDSATCRILRSRARYSPARDSKGNPVPGSDAGELRWTLPAS